MAEARTKAAAASSFAEKSAVKQKLKDAFAISKYATASVGKFDQKLENEPKIKGKKGKTQKRTAVAGDMGSEKARQLALLSKIGKKGVTIQTATGVASADSEAPISFEPGKTKKGKKGKIQTRFAPKGPKKREKKM